MPNKKDAVQVSQQGKEIESAISVRGVLEQIQQVQDLMAKAMKKGEHYGVIPGCGDKPTLLKSGAEKINFMFSFRPEYVVHRTDFEKGHREYQVDCFLYSMRTGHMVSQGVGTCSTLESKWKYRTEKINTGEMIPKDYKKNKGSYRAKGFACFKDNEGKWGWYKIKKVDHTDPADYYNTCLKMGKKRAFVDATITATATSDIFTQDIEDMGHLINSGNSKTTEKKQQTRNQKKTAPAEYQESEPPFTKDEPRQESPGFSSQPLFDEQGNQVNIEPQETQPPQQPPSGNAPANNNVPITDNDLRDLENLLMSEFKSVNALNKWLKESTYKADPETGEVLNNGFNHIGEIRTTRQLNWVKGLFKRR